MGSALLMLLSVSSPAEDPTDGLDVVQRWDEVVASSPALEEFERRRWIRHRVRPRERVSQIAARYGVRKAKLVEWNRLDPQQPFPPKRRRTVKIFTKRRPPARVKVAYLPSEGQTWGDVASQLRVEIPDLHGWNWRQRKLVPGRPLVAWVDPGQPWLLHPGEGPEVPASFDVPEGGRSVGRPHKGRLLEGVQLPESDLYTRGIKRVLWGSSYTIENLLEAFANFRHDTGYEHEVIVGSISKRGGRRLPPHKSHQSGRDVDIRLPLLPHVPDTPRPNPDEVDWYATWGLIKALGQTDAVSVIFLDADLHRRVYEAARVMGESREFLVDYLIFPLWKPKSDPLVRHSSGHDSHIHVRFKCGPEEKRCRRR